MDEKVFRRIAVTEEDVKLYDLLPKLNIIDETLPDKLRSPADTETTEAVSPTETYHFLHEAAIISYHGRLFAAWYHSRRAELRDETPICYATSRDGKAWSEPIILAQDLTGTILYCPPVFELHEDRLYLFLNQMVSADHIHSLDLYVYEEKTNAFRQLWSRPIPFKLNTNCCHLENGKLLLPGRIGELDGFPNTPAVLICDSGDPEADWRLVKLQEDGALPDGSEYVHPELTVLENGTELTAFCRNDQRSISTLYHSEDYGEHWTGPYAVNFPFAATKIYSGTLSDGRHYVIGNLQPYRYRMVMLLSEPGSPYFSKGYLLADGTREGQLYHYPCACEQEGKLYVAYTANSAENSTSRRMMVSCLPIGKL